MTALATQPETPPVAADREAGDMVVKCVNLVKVFKDFWMRNRVVAVGGTRPGAPGTYEGIDFEIYRGEVFGLLGPNGSGKSTTIKMILGLLHPTAGRIGVFGKPPSDVSIKERIGYLPEESYLYRFLNARETLDYYGRLFHQDRRQRQKRIDMLLEMVGLDRAQRRPVGEYSKGMQRRIGLAQALINDPELLILDEPTTGLDPIGTRQVKDLILDLARPRKGKPGKTVLLCSHLLADVEDVCDRVAIMFGGKIRKYGTVEQLLVQEERTTIQAPALPPEVIQQIEEVLERHGQHIEKVEHPRQKLETLFLEIVNQALAEGLHTSGAGMGGRTAEFLTESGAETGEGVIDRLVAGEGDKRAAASPPESPAAAPVAKSPDVDAKVVEQLQAPESKPAPQAERPTPRPAPQPKQPAAPVDDSVIGSLLSGQPPQEPSTPPPAPRAAPEPKPAPAAQQPKEPSRPPEPKKPAPQAPVAPPSDSARRTPSSIPVAAEDRQKRETDEQPDRDFLDALIKSERPDDEPKKR